ncbi:MAG: hypothetical protein ABSH56_02345 [Bryobacteraceae bacterium]
MKKRFVMRVGNMLTLLLASNFGIVPLRAQGPPIELHLTIIEGDGAINNLQRRTAREPIVQVTDQNHRPVGGVAVSFELSGTGPGGAFKGANVLKVMTNAKGIAKAAGFRPNTIPGSFQIHVTASFQGHVAAAAIAQTNTLAGAVPAASSAGASAGVSGSASGASSGAAAGSGIASSTAGGGATGAGAAGVGAAGAGAGAAAAAGISTTVIVATAAGVAGAVVAAKVATSSGSNSTSQTPTPPSGTIGAPGTPVVGPSMAPRSGVPVFVLRLAGNRFARQAVRQAAKQAVRHISFGKPANIGGTAAGRRGGRE